MNKKILGIALLSLAFSPLGFSHIDDDELDQLFAPGSGHHVDESGKYERVFQPSPRELWVATEEINIFLETTHYRKRVEVHNLDNFASFECTFVYYPLDGDLGAILRKANKALSRIEYPDYNVKSYNYNPKTVPEIEHYAVSTVLLEAKINSPNKENTKNIHFDAKPGQRDLTYSCTPFNLPPRATDKNPLYRYQYVEGVKYMQYYNIQSFRQNCSFHDHKGKKIKESEYIDPKSWSKWIINPTKSMKEDCLY